MHRIIIAAAITVAFHAAALAQRVCIETRGSACVRYVDEGQAAAPGDAERELRLNAEDRRMVQRGLKVLGYFHAGLTGTFNGSTRSAIKRWQRAYGVAVTGYLSLDQVHVLIAAASKRKEPDRLATATPAAGITTEPATNPRQTKTTGATAQPLAGVWTDRDGDWTIRAEIQETTISITTRHIAAGRKADGQGSIKPDGNIGLIMMRGEGLRDRIVSGRFPSLRMSSGGGRGGSANFQLRRK